MRGLLVANVLLFATASPAAANYPRPGLTERVAVASDGTQAEGASAGDGFSADARLVMFSSLAANLVAGDTNGSADVFVHDRLLGITERVSVANDGAQGNDNSSAGDISADARFVAFGSAASNLVAGDTNGEVDVFVRDRLLGTTERVSVASDGSQGNGFTGPPTVSSDGRYVAFVSLSSNLVGGDTNAKSDIFVRDRLLGTTERVSVAPDGSQANDLSAGGEISADGRVVAFLSRATNLAPGERTPWRELYLRDRLLGTTERVSVASDGTRGNEETLDYSVSADGRFVAFTCLASNLVAGDTNETSDIFVRDRLLGTTERVSIASDGAQGGWWSMDVSISAGGRYVAFDSFSNLAPGLPNIWPDVYVRDRVFGLTDRVSLTSDGFPAEGHSVSPDVSADGRYVAFDSTAFNLVPGDTDQGSDYDAFVRDRGPELGALPDLAVSTLPGGVKVSGRAALSGARLAGEDDPVGGDPLLAPAPWADIVSADLSLRPEAEDLLFRIRTAAAPPVAAGAPATLYGWSFTRQGTRYELRAIQASADDPGSPSLGLYRCDPLCREQAGLKGVFWNTGPEVIVSLPLSLLQGSGQITSPRTFTGMGDPVTGAIQVLDDLSLADDIAIPSPRMEVGIAPAGTAEESVSYPTVVHPAQGSFAATLPLPSAGDWEIFARACIATSCGGAISVRLHV